MSKITNEEDKLVVDVLREFSMRNVQLAREVVRLRTREKNIADMEGQEGMTDCLFAERTLAIVNDA